MANDQPRRDRAQPLGREAELFELGAADAEDADIGLCDQIVELHAPGLGFEVDGHDLLARVELPGSLVLLALGSEFLHPVTTRLLNAGDAGTEIDKHLAAHRACYALGDFQHLQSCEHCLGAHAATSALRDASRAAIRPCLSVKLASTMSVCSPSRGGPPAMPAGVCSNRQCGA